MGQAVETLDMQNIMSLFASVMVEQWYSFKFDIVTLLDVHGYIRYISEKCFNLLGVEPHNMIGTLVFDIVHQDDFMKTLSSFKHLVSTAEPIDMNVRAVRPDGGILHFNIKGEPIIDNGKVIGIVVMSRKNILFLGEYVNCKYCKGVS